MCEPVYLPPQMLETLRAMGLLRWPENDAAWKLLGYIDWLEDKLDWAGAKFNINWRD